MFGADNARPANEKFNGAGMDLSPALNGRLNFSETDRENDKVDCRFVADANVPDGTWKTIITTSQIQSRSSSAGNDSRPCRTSGHRAIIRS